MKKIVALIITGIMLFSFTSSVFAVSEENIYYDNYWQVVYNS